MALTYSTMMNLGTKAKSFSLLDTVSSKIVSLKDLKGEKGTVILFICNHCPFVKHVNETIVTIANEFIPKGISFIAICPNDAEKYPEDGPEKMKEMASLLNYPFPYLYDETQQTAKKYDAVCTPDNFIFDKDLKLIYRGRLDDTRPGNGVSNGNEIKGALNALVLGQFVSEIQYPSMGCSIKWK